MRNKRAAGFTLVEVLVMVAAVGLLVALLTPAVQQARETARRTICTDNLKQLGIALYAYHDAYAAFSPGMVALPQHADDAKLPIWSVPLLPFVEQEAVYLQLRAETSDYTREIPFAQAGPTSAAFLPLPRFQCPADTMGAANLLRGGVGKSNYLASSGTQVAADGQFPTDTHRSDAWDGAFTYGQSRRLKEFRDGVSNTIMIGERDGGDVVRGGISSRQAGAWAGTENAAVFGQVFSVASSTFPINSPNSGFEPYRSFGSFHPGGAMFVYADGHVSFMTDNVSGGIYEAMATRAGEEFVVSFD